MDILVRIEDTTISYEVRRPDLRFTVRLVGGDRNWSLGNLYTQQDAYTHTELAQDLRFQLETIGAEHVFAPTPTKFNGKIILPSTLTTRIVLSDKLVLLRNKEDPADGTFLQAQGDAGIISAGGCPIIVASYLGQLIFAHAGRDCLIDRTWIDTDYTEKGRPNESVVDSILEAFKATRPDRVFNPDNVEAWAFGSIQSKDFYDDLEDPLWGTRNQKTSDYIRERFGEEAVDCEGPFVGYDLPVIIKEQFARHGVRHVNTAHASLPSWFTTTRSKKDKDKRLLIAVVRNL